MSDFIGNLDFKAWLKSQDAKQTPRSTVDIDGEHIGKPTDGDAFTSLGGANDPIDFASVQWKWKCEKDQGRPFYNIDLDDYLKNRHLVGVESLSMPGVEGFWRHKPDDERPAIKIIPGLKWKAWGISENPNKRNIMKWKSVVSDNRDLKKIFGDEGTNSQQKEFDG